MFKIKTPTAQKYLILFSIINSSLFLGFHPSGIFRLFLVFLMMSSGFLLVVFSYKLSRKEFPITPYFKILFFLILAWSSFTIFRSINPNIQLDNLKTLFGHYLMGWAWVSPLGIFFGFKVRYWKNLFPFFSKLLLFGSFMALIGAFLSKDIALGLLKWMAFIPFLFLTFFYQNRKRKLILIISIISYLILTVIISQRANFLFLMILLFFFTIEFFNTNQVKKFTKKMMISIMVLFGLFFLFQVNNIYQSLVKNEDLTTDTRTFLFQELFLDMSVKELIIGRGAMGTYYSPYFAYTEKHGLPGDSSTRSVNEVGYLHIIFKGGFIMLFLYLLILIPAAYLGIKKSNNIIARMCGYYITAYLLLWTLTYYPVYSAEHILLWMAAGTAIAGKARNLTDEELFPNLKKLTAKKAIV